MGQHILSLSYGKDSLACLGAIEELGWPLDRIVHDFDRRFALEDEGIINPIHPFRWAMLDGDVQLRF